MPTESQEIEFSELLMRNHNTINNICLRYCGDNMFYFDELRQECVMAIWREFSIYDLSRLRNPSAESNWIYKICYLHIAYYLRTPQNQDIHTSTDISDIEHLINTEPTQDRSLLDELTLQLKPHECVMLNHYLNDDSYTTISRVEGITEDNARKQMSRLLNKIRILLHR